MTGKSIAALIGALALGACSAAQRDPGPSPGAGFETVTLLEHAPGGITVTTNERVILSQHQFYNPEIKVIEWREHDGSIRPYPNEHWARAPGADEIGFNAVLAVRATDDDELWLLDNGLGTGRPPRMIMADLVTNEVERVIDLSGVAPSDGFFQDFALDPFHEFAYIADPAGGANAALVVVDLDSGEARRVLEGDASVVPEDVELTIDGQPFAAQTPDGRQVPVRVGVNPITIDWAYEWVYFGPMNGRSLYRIPTSSLRDPDRSDADLQAEVERYGDKPISDGITIDRRGNVYVTDLAANGIGVVEPDGRYRLLFSDPQISFPNGMAYHPDGYVYVTVAQLHRSPRFNGGADRSQPPFRLIRFVPFDESSIGR
ncbi:L-dopachrome tautomerase-related protein [Marinivivus vitaminiproducens]|uniref:L-dopachrome tautomerase-related protein n=1 Tax=Marinivivus vitaminiproducens TaxID=3035935 RepID=UPI00279EFCBF|nr:L-dopachrome tautomerase-related protein [Geminicoccaceae bacterium SCSIO 64248]